MPIRKSRISGIVASGTSADRPSSPSVGDTFFNGTLGVQEIYTDSGWIPATGANDFNINLSGSETAVTLDKEYFSGSYTITSALGDTAFDVYLFNTQNLLVGYSKTPSINATGDFNKILIYGGTTGDLLTFTYKTTFTTSETVNDVFAAPYITSISAPELKNIDDTTTITGGNFDTDIQVWFDGQNSYSQQAKSVVYGSSTSVVATRPDSLSVADEPFTVRLVNPGITESTGSNRHKLIDAITVGSAPVWNTAAGLLPLAPVGNIYSSFLQATDPDGQNITYAITSGSLLAGLSFNTTTGEITGTPISEGGAEITVTATDSAGKASSRSFIIATSIATGGTVNQSGGYKIHTFTSNGTFILNAPTDVEYLVVAGGGGGGWDVGGGGGAGGFLSSTVSLSSGSYSVLVGAGGAGSTTNSNQASSGDDSSFSNIAVATGGGYGGNWNGSDPAYRPGGNGGSGGGGGGWSQSQASAYGGSGIPGQGNDGGFGGGGTYWTGGGGGGAGGAGSNSIDSNGGTVSGGAGLSSSISGTSIVYATGGDGKGDAAGGSAAGAANRGDGADGGGSANTGPAGGSGIVIVRYAI